MNNNVSPALGRVYITCPIPLSGVDFLNKKGIEVAVRSENSPIDKDLLEKEARASDALITMLSDKIDREFLEKNPHLKIITNYAVGFNNIDVGAATRLKIAIGNTPDVLTFATAEIAFALMIAAARNFKWGFKDAESGAWGNWEPMKYLGQDLRGKTLAIIGNGRIGKTMAQMCQSVYAMKVISTNSQSTTEEFHRILKEADVVSLHVPLTEKTRHLIGEREFSLMKPSAILINTARGEIVHQEALYRTLKEERIFAAGIDVTTPEPLPPSHALYSLKNLFILPHIGSATKEAREAMSLLAAQNIWAAFSGNLAEGSIVNKKDLRP